MGRSSGKISSRDYQGIVFPCSLLSESYSAGAQVSGQKPGQHEIRPSVTNVDFCSPESPKPLNPKP